MTTTGLQGVRLLDAAQRAKMRPELLDVIEYRKSELDRGVPAGLRVLRAAPVRQLRDEGAASADER